MELEIYSKAVAKARAGDYQAAIWEFSQVIEINPNFVEAYYGRGLAKFDLGEEKEAIADYTQALAINPDYINAYLGRGMARLAIGDILGSIEDANRIISININYAPAYKLLGSAYRQQNNQESAIAYFKRGAELYLEQKDAVNCRKCLNNIKNLQSVSAPPVEAKHNANSKKFLTLVLEKIEKGDHKGAIEDLNWALQVDAQDAQAYCCRGIIRYKQGDNLGAISDFNKALQLNDNDVLAYRNRGMIRSQMGDSKGAIADFNAVLKIEPNNTVTYIIRGNAFRDMGAYQEAIADYEQALKINPREAKALYNRGIVYSRLEEMTKAVGDYQNAAQLFGDGEDWSNYQKTLDQLKKIQTSIPSQDMNEDAKYRQLQQQLLRMVGGHWEIAEQLITKFREKYPGRNRVWYLEKIISDWQQQ